MTFREDSLPFCLPDIGDEEISAVVAALRSGWLSSGPKVKEFEANFAAQFGDGVEAVAVNSATAGLHLALEAVGVQPGDCVLVPTWTFTATAEVVRYLGAEPILVDCDPITLNIDFEDAARKVTDRTKAVMPVHFAGYPIDSKVIEDFAEAYGLKVVEDAAHAFPASSNGRMVGASNSPATVFSFYATKTITTGEGGMVVTRDPSIAKRIRVMRLHGISRDAFDRYRSTTPAWQYEVVAPGYKYNLTDPAAAMGLVQLARAGEMRDRRAEISLRYSDDLGDLDIELPPEVPDSIKHAWHLYVVRLGSALAREKFIDELASAGVGTSVHFIPLHKQPYWRERGGYGDSDFPIASREFERCVSLPLYSRMSDHQVQRVVTAVRRALN